MQTNWFSEIQDEHSKTKYGKDDNVCKYSYIKVNMSKSMDNMKKDINMAPRW